MRSTLLIPTTDSKANLWQFVDESHRVSLSVAVCLSQVCGRGLQSSTVFAVVGGHEALPHSNDVLSLELSTDPPSSSVAKCIYRIYNCIFGCTGPYCSRFLLVSDSVPILTSDNYVIMAFLMLEIVETETSLLKGFILNLISNSPSILLLMDNWNIDGILLRVFPNSCRLGLSLGVIPMENCSVFSDFLL